MATTADATPTLHSPSPTTLHSPRASAAPALEGGASAASPQYRRRGGGGVSSPWTRIVRGGHDSESTLPSSSSPSSGPVVISGGSVAPPLILPPPVEEEQIMNSDLATAAEAANSLLPAAAGDALPEGSEKSDNGNGGGSNATKKPAWNKPSNGGTEVGPVMGAVSWPALSESTRASPKSSSSDFSKTLSDGSPPVVQGGEITSTTLTLPSANKQVPGTTANSNSTSNHPHNRQRSMRRSGGNTSNNPSSNGGISQLSSPRGTPGDTTHGNYGKHANPSSDSSSRENVRDGGQRSQSHIGNEHQQQRNSFRRGGGGPHPRGDGPHHHGYGARRGDQDRVNQDWNSNRSFGGRDAQVHNPRVNPRPFIRNPTPNPPQPYYPPPALHMRPVSAPLIYPELYYVTGPPQMVHPMAPLVVPSFQDPQLHAKIINQIDYYFSNDNLIKDTFLRQNMDDQGWVPIKLIASFKKVMQLTDNIQFILDSVRSSSVVEVEGEKVRRRNDWGRWIMPTSVQHPAVSSPQSLQRSSQEMLAASFHGMGLEDKTAAKHGGYAEKYLSPSSSGEWSSLSQQSTGEKTGQAGFPLSSAPNSSK